MYYHTIILFVTHSFLQTSQRANITSMDGNSMSSHVSTLAMGTGTIIAPSETTVNDDIDNTDCDSDYSYMFYYYSGSEASESDNEESGSSSVNTPRSVLSSKLISCCLYGDSSSDSDAITDVNYASGSICVVAGCQMCMLYIMVPIGTSACFRCGNSGLIHFGGSGQT